MKIRIIGATLTFLFLVACQSMQNPTNNQNSYHRSVQGMVTTQKKAPKNIILFIGDGMGPAYIKAYRMLKDNPQTPQIETTVFDGLLVGQLRTDPASSLQDVEVSVSDNFKLSVKKASDGIRKGNDKTNPSKKQHQRNLITDSESAAVAYATGKKHLSSLITDSAASATAYATGNKVKNGVLSINQQNKASTTVLERAKQQGKSTGIVVTSQINHATPAAFLAHEQSRRHLNSIADQYIDNRIKGRPYADILLGGGTNYFERSDRNIVDEFRMLGYQTVKNRDELLASTSPQILGLFAPVGLPKYIDRSSDIPSLAEMVKVATKQLSKNPKGIFLMVEGSQIDWAGHYNDIVGAMSEMQDFDLAVQEALKFAKQDGDTQIIVTADHSTGGLSTGARVDGKSYYQWNSHLIQSVNHSPKIIAKKAKEQGDLLKAFNDNTSISLNDAEKKMLSTFNFNQKLLDENNRPLDKKSNEKAILWEAEKLLIKLINKKSYTGWTTGGHTGVDVNLYAFGPFSKEFSGNRDNTEIAEKIFKWLDEK